MNSSEEIFDVIVIGGGVSGLTTARKIRDSKLKVLVLEARDRVGGRTYTPDVYLDDGTKISADLGGMWIGKTHKRLLDLVKEFDLKYYVTYHEGKKIQEVCGKISSYKGLIPSLGILSLLSLDQLMKYINKLSTELVSQPNTFSSELAKKYDGKTVRTFLTENSWTNETISVMEVLSRAVFSAEPEELSLLFFLYYIGKAGSIENLTETENGGQMYLLEGGMQAVSIKLAEDLGEKIVKLNHQVQRIEYDKNSVRIFTNSGKKFTAKKCVIAVSPSICNSIHFEPFLPPKRQQLQQRCPMGCIMKVYLYYKTAWWRKAGFSGEIISDVGPVTAFFDSSFPPEFTPSPAHANKPKYLIGFIISKHLNYWGEKSQNERRKACEEQINRLFNGKCEKAIGYVECDWRKERYSGGCYTGIAGPGVLSAFGDSLKEPIGNLHFGGTETSDDWCGYIEGAIESGERVANEILNPGSTKSTSTHTSKKVHSTFNLKSVMFFAVVVLAVSFLVMKFF